jgi:hypothetical protein
MRGADILNTPAGLMREIPDRFEKQRTRSDRRQQLEKSRLGSATSDRQRPFYGLPVELSDRLCLRENSSGQGKEVCFTIGAMSTAAPAAYVDPAGSSS